MLLNWKRKIKHLTFLLSLKPRGVMSHIGYSLYRNVAPQSVSCRKGFAIYGTFLDLKGTCRTDFHVVIITQGVRFETFAVL